VFKRRTLLFLPFQKEEFGIAKIESASSVKALTLEENHPYMLKLSRKLIPLISYP